MRLQRGRVQAGRRGRRVPDGGGVECPRLAHGAGRGRTERGAPPVDREHEMSDSDWRCLPEMLDAQAARTPDAVAVVHGSEWLTYRELHMAAGRLAAVLRSRGVGPESLVGVLSTRTSRLIAALLAVVKAGGAYLPLDPDHPPARLAFM